MKIWILTAKFGHGHFSAAEALKEELSEYGHEVLISDVVETLYPKLAHAAYYMFNHFICRHNKIYNVLSEFGRSAKESNNNKDIIHQEIDRIKPDIIICTWSGCARVIGDVDIPVYVCVTDVGIHCGWISDNVQGYFVASKEAANKMVSLGADMDKIFVQGIPVKNAFKGIKTKKAHDKKILIMGGGLGIISWIDEALESLIPQIDIDITVITGNNKKLYKKLKKKYPSINVVGFTKEVHRYMEEADLLLSKPGGISLFESIYSETPCVAVYPEYTHEVENAHYILNQNIGAVVWKGESINDGVMRILRSSSKKKEFKVNIMRIKREIEITKARNTLWRYSNVI